ncbi:Sua5/YciO/YrdC/YwlC family protein [Variovorax sp. KK3]|uniref:Sua5/YciO/YrdC/YwlC family protein n=1 Tax=Variovorax sp. KK3 TaxID=1855728 RepID=UPI00097C7C18|nr:Sua5/YciO/YrdC/YwlC family protein [Variovorax sp. KK3]
MNIQADARRVIDTIKAGGIALVPNDTGYAFCGSSLEPLRTIFENKRRGSHKRNAMAASLETQRELHTLDKRAQQMVETLVLDHDLPLAVVGTFREDHPLMRKLDPELLRASSAAGTVALLLNAGTFHAELCRLGHDEVVPLLGSSANYSGTGTRFRVEDIPEELRRIADITIDHGLRRGHLYKRAGTVINFSTMEVVRIGAYYELISDVLRRFFDVELPPDPGLDALPSGHLNEFALRDLS